jgi:hypothetical protein
MDRKIRVLDQACLDVVSTGDDPRKLGSAADHIGVARVSALAPKAVRLHCFARVAQWVRSARMLVMQEDRELRSYGFSLRGHRLPK